MRLMPQTSASPSGFLAAASETIPQMLFGRSQNVGTTRSPKRASSCMAGTEYCDQSIAASQPGPDPTGVESGASVIFLFEHDLFGKPISTFTDDALALRLHAIDMFRASPAPMIPKPCITFPRESPTRITSQWRSTGAAV